jgi:hypothetical protein
MLRGAQIAIQSKATNGGDLPIHLHVENVNNQTKDLNVNYAAAHKEILS